LLHPFIPFITEEIYQYLYKDQKSIMLEKYPTIIKNVFSTKDKSHTNLIIGIFNFAKNLRIKHNLKLIQTISINLITTTKCDLNLLNATLKVSNVNIMNISINRINKNACIFADSKYLIEYSEDFIDKKLQLENLNKKLNHLTDEIERSKKILNNNNFIKKAPIEKVNIEKKKYEDYLKQYQELLKTIQKH
jgi:valyl-tRNA synthetase